MIPAREPGSAKAYRCPGCGGGLGFDPASGLLKCAHCGSTAPLPESGVIPTHALEEFLAQSAAHALQPMSAQALEVHCDGCGSVVAFEPPEVAGVCPFCAVAIVAQPKAADPLIAPDAVLPAKVGKPAAQQEVTQWLASRWFAPSALKQLAKQEGISAVYVPFWSYSADTISEYTGMRGNYYWETEEYTETDSSGNSVQRTRQVQRIAWFPAGGQVSRAFSDVLAPASKSVVKEKLEALEPWDLEALRSYDPVYLAGFKAQRYQIELPEGFTEAKARMAEVIEQDVRRDIGGDQQNVNSVDTAYANAAFRHLLLPVWIGAYRFQDKVFQVVVNARTGEVQGERPYSAVKIALVLLAAILLIVLLVVLRSNS